MTIRAFSYGGGTQSTAALVLAARGEIDFPTFLFANVGHDSENPATIDYVRDVAHPYASAKGVELVDLRYTTRTGETPTLLEVVRAGKRSIPIPVRMGKDGAPGNRSCTGRFKIKVIERELKRRGATTGAPAAVGIGISLDELHRAGSAVDPRSLYQLREYPLVDLGLDRARCKAIIADEGLPIPERSSCYFCPFKRDEEWRRLARMHPDEFNRACTLERELHERGLALGRGEFYFSRHGAFLDQLFDGNDMTLFSDEPQDEMETCNAGHCFT